MAIIKIFNKLDIFGDPEPPVIRWALQFLLFIATVCVFVPFRPGMPMENLDSSWVFGMNQAVSQGLAFGRELVFTYGPYAAIYTRTYHPATDFLMMFGSSFLALCYGFAALLVTRNCKWYLLILFWIILSGLIYLRDPLFLSYPLMAGMACYRLLHAHETRASFLSLLVLLILFLPFGLLSLIKGSFIFLCVAIAALIFVLFLSAKQLKLALAVIIFPILSMLFFWIMSGQSVFSLPSYYISISSIAAGYSEAMSISGLKWEYIVYIPVSIFLLLATCREDRNPSKDKAIVLLMFFAYLFVSFKGGFVRHDEHAVIAGLCLLFAGLFFALEFDSRRASFVLLFCALTWLGIDAHYIKTSTRSILANISSTYSTPWIGLKQRMTDSEWLPMQYKNAEARIRKQSGFLEFKGSTDIYSYGQSSLIASGNRWNPRPIFQSYSAYTTELANMNKNHLLGDKAPDNIIFKIEPIDNRLPSLEDGASWPILFNNYYPSVMNSDYLYLQKRASAEVVKESLLSEGMYSLGNSVTIPNESPVYAEISIKPTILGKIAAFLYKPDQLQITIHLQNGQLKTYRFIPRMAESGILISPLIENTAEFGFLFGDKGLLSGKKVQSFSITPVHSIWQWKSVYRVALKKIPPAKPMDVLQVYRQEGPISSLRNAGYSAGDSCDRSFEPLSSMFPSSFRFNATGLLRVK
jgi:hypothetical protein